MQKACGVDGCERPFVAKGMCQHHYRKQWYRANREEVDAYNARYYAANREKYAEWNQKWCRENRLRKTAGGNAWRAANYERYSAYQALWRSQNADLLREFQSNRRELERRAVTVPFTFEQWEQRAAYYGGKCWICRRAEYEHIDHVKPLTKGGAHMLSNLRPACGPCNRAKNATWPFDVAQIRDKVCGTTDKDKR